MVESPVVRLTKTNPDLEVWWDSSPLVYANWVEKMLNQSSSNKRSKLGEQLKQLYNADDPASSIFRGCTTNPPLSLQAVQSDSSQWNEWIDTLIQEKPDLTCHELAWLTYKEVIQRGAKMYLPIHQASRARFGWISGQLDPRLFTEIEMMVQQARELSDLSPNVMIKVPASMQGVEVVKELTARGISTNVTICFTLPQVMAVANAAMEGRHLADERRVDLSSWRAVITIMVGRLTENPTLEIQAARRNIKLSWQDKHWFGIAVFRRAYRLLIEGGYASKLLACSMRDGPVVAGKRHFWDIEKIAGGEIVYTCPPYVLEPLFEIGDGLSFKVEIGDEIPREVMGKLMKIPYCLQAYEPNGLAEEQFNDHPATVSTVNAFAKGFSGLEEYVMDRMVRVTGEKPKTYQAIPAS